MARLNQSDCIFVSFSVIECEPLDVISNGVITYSADITPNYMYELETEATYDCNEGFFLNISVGARVRTCVRVSGMEAAGVFTGQAPSCDGKFVLLFYTINYLRKVMLFTCD